MPLHKHPEGAVVLLTGATSGIGEQLAWRLAREPLSFGVTYSVRVWAGRGAPLAAGRRRPRVPATHGY